MRRVRNFLGALLLPYFLVKLSPSLFALALLCALGWRYRDALLTRLLLRRARRSRESPAMLADADRRPAASDPTATTMADECAFCSERFDRSDRWSKLFPKRLPCCGCLLCAGCVAELQRAAGPGVDFRCPICGRASRTDPDPDTLADDIDGLSISKATAMSKPISASAPAAGRRFWCLQCAAVADADCEEQHAICRLRAHRLAQMKEAVDALESAERQRRRLAERTADLSVAVRAAAQRQEEAVQEGGQAQRALSLLHASLELAEPEWQRVVEEVEATRSEEAERLAADEEALRLLDSARSCRLAVLGADGECWRGDVGLDAERGAAKAVLAVLLALSRAGQLPPASANSPEEERAQVEVAEAKRQAEEVRAEAKLEVEKARAEVVEAKRQAEEAQAEAKRQAEKAQAEAKRQAEEAQAEAKRQADTRIQAEKAREEAKRQAERAQAEAAEARRKHEKAQAEAYEARRKIEDTKVIDWLSWMSNYKGCGPSQQGKSKAEALDIIQRRGALKLTTVHCDADPDWTLRLLSAASARTEELWIVDPRVAHMRVVAQAVALRRLCVWCYDDELWKPPVGLSAQPFSLSLEALRVYRLPRPWLVSLLRASAGTLRRLRLGVGTPGSAPWPKNCNDAPALLAECGLSALRKLVLGRGLLTHEKSKCPDQLQALRRKLPYAEVLCSDCNGLSHCDGLDGM